jgi:hypothetical protein
MTFGFKRGDDWVVCVRYTVRAGSRVPDRAGSVFATADISGAVFYSHATYTDAFNHLTSAEQNAFKATLPHQRRSAPAPGTAAGYWVSDKTYGAGGVEATRETFRPYS